MIRSVQLKYRWQFLTLKMLQNTAQLNVSQNIGTYLQQNDRSTIIA